MCAEKLSRKSYIILRDGGVHETCDGPTFYPGIVAVPSLLASCYLKARPLGLSIDYLIKLTYPVSRCSYVTSLYWWSDCNPGGRLPCYVNFHQCRVASNRFHGLK